jgi:putative tryptophan/tyrosine transport system substrate-binding protein
LCAGDRDLRDVLAPECRFDDTREKCVGGLWAENRLDQLPEMAAELIRRQVAVIVTTGGPTSAFAAKEATTTIPVVFLVGEDPVRLGLVSSLARPSGNLTGINLLTNELEAKRLELLHQLVPRAVRIAVLVTARAT